MRTSVTHSFQPKTVDQLFTLYQSDAIRRGKVSAHDDGSRYRCHIQQRIGHLSLAEVTPDHVTSCLPYHRTPATRQRVLALIRAMFNWAKRRRLYRGDNPTDGVDRERFDNRRTTYLNPKEIRRLIDCLEDAPVHFRLLVKGILFSGRRRGELLDLEWTDVDLDARLVTYRKTKNRRTQTLPIAGPFLEVIQQAKLLRRSERSTRVFPTRSGGRYSGLSWVWMRFRKKHHFEGVRIHDLRHTAASLLASSGAVTLIELKELLGHRDLSMTMRYSHLMPDGLRRTVEKAAGVWGF